MEDVENTIRDRLEIALSLKKNIDYLEWLLTNPLPDEEYVRQFIFDEIERSVADLDHVILKPGRYQ
jgi:hypothetical protein